MISLRTCCKEVDSAWHTRLPVKTRQTREGPANRIILFPPLPFVPRRSYRCGCIGTGVVRASSFVSQRSITETNVNLFEQAVDLKVEDDALRIFDGGCLLRIGTGLGEIL